jgi:hypothetical protein
MIPTRLPRRLRFCAIIKRRSWSSRSWGQITLLKGSTIGDMHGIVISANARIVGVRIGSGL